MSKNHDFCQHIESTFDWHGNKIPYTAHIQVVPGGRKGVEVVDDVHIEVNPNVLPPGLAKWLATPCEKCRSQAESIMATQRPTFTNVMKVAETHLCKHNENSLYGEVAKGALDLYMLKQLNG